MAVRSDIYAGRDPRDVPMYTVAEAARYLHIPAPTVRSWVFGRDYPKGGVRVRFQPVIQRPSSADQRLSFRNLVELAALRALRSVFQVDMQKVRDALDHARRRHHLDNLLASRDLYAAPGEIFLKRYGQLINLSRADQLAMEVILKGLLTRIEWDRKSPVRFFPSLPVATDRNAKTIVIDPRIAFGKPVLTSKAISTAVIAERINAGEQPRDIATDYGVTESEVTDALAYERAA